MKSKKASSARKRSGHLKKAKSMKKVRPLAVTASLLNTGTAVANPPKHEGWIEIDSFSFGASNPAGVGSNPGGGTGQAGQIDFNDLSITPPKP